MSKPGFVALLSYHINIIEKEYEFSFYMLLFMFLCLINPKICRSEEALVLNLCKITEKRKQKLKVEILNDLKKDIKKNF